MKYKITLIGLLIFTFSCSKKSMNNTSGNILIPIDGLIGENPDAAIAEISTELKKLGLDKVDVAMIIEGPLLQTMIIKSQTDDIKLAYGDIIDAYNEFRNEPDFQSVKNRYEKILTIQDKIVDASEWPQVKQELTSLDVEPQLISDLNLRIEKWGEKTMTYRELIKFIVEERNNKSTNITGELTDNSDISLEKALEKSLLNKKPVLLYFTCKTCVNSLKMEEYVFSNTQILQILLSEYIFVWLNVDNKELVAKNGETIAERNKRLQREKFFSNSQPFFAKLDSNGNVITTAGYTPEIEQFKRFLTKK